MGASAKGSHRSPHTTAAQPELPRVAVFMGTRPEAIKMAPVVKALEADAALQPIVISTGQHQEMLQQVVDLFNLTVDHHLDVMEPNQTLASLTARLITRVDAVLGLAKPDFALVQGDTTTVLAAALACFYRHIPVGHVEAGLRTGNIQSPFPEEANRKLASSIVTLHFPPTPTSRENLLAEHVDPRRITVTGNTVIDALQLEVRRQSDLSQHDEISGELAHELGADWDQTPYVLITGHRRENLGGGFDQICEAIATLAQRFPHFRFIYPVHLNPNVQGVVHQKLGGHVNIRLISPRHYRHFVALMNGCYLVLTDSGGVQEEAPSLGKPVLVMRDTTERPEGVAAGTVRLVGADRDSIIKHTSELIQDEAAYARMSKAANPYGDGQAARKICEALTRFFAMKNPIR